MEWNDFNSKQRKRFKNKCLNEMNDNELRHKNNNDKQVILTTGTKANDIEVI